MPRQYKPDVEGPLTEKIIDINGPLKKTHFTSTEFSVIKELYYSIDNLFFELGKRDEAVGLLFLKHHVPEIAKLQGKKHTIPAELEWYSSGAPREVKVLITKYYNSSPAEYLDDHGITPILPEEKPVHSNNINQNKTTTYSSNQKSFKPVLASDWSDQSYIIRELEKAKEENGWSEMPRLMSLRKNGHAKLAEAITTKLSGGYEFAKAILGFECDLEWLVKTTMQSRSMNKLVQTPKTSDDKLNIIYTRIKEQYQTIDNFGQHHNIPFEPTLVDSKKVEDVDTYTTSTNKELQKELDAKLQTKKASNSKKPVSKITKPKTTRKSSLLTDPNFRTAKQFKTVEREVYAIMKKYNWPTLPSLQILLDCGAEGLIRDMQAHDGIAEFRKQMNLPSPKDVDWTLYKTSMSNSLEDQTINITVDDQ